MLNKIKQKWNSIFGVPPPNFKHNNQMRVFTDQNREWLDIDYAPRGVKLHLLTREGMPTHGEVTESTKFQFKGWEPLPSTPHWMKEIR